MLGARVWRVFSLPLQHILAINSTHFLCIWITCVAEVYVDQLESVRMCSKLYVYDVRQYLFRPHVSLLNKKAFSTFNAWRLIHTTQCDETMAVNFMPRALLVKSQFQRDQHFHIP